MQIRQYFNHVRNLPAAISGGCSCLVCTATLSFAPKLQCAVLNNLVFDSRIIQKKKAQIWCHAASPKARLRHHNSEAAFTGVGRLCELDNSFNAFCHSFVETF
jgi:hypothetical protein